MDVLEVFSPALKKGVDIYEGETLLFVDTNLDKSLLDIKIGKDILLIKKSDDIIYWSTLEWHHSNADGVDPWYTVCMYGYGMKTLREPRHTWFGDKYGYLFYVKPILIKTTFDILKEYFDFDD